MMPSSMLFSSAIFIFDMMWLITDFLRHFLRRYFRCWLRLTFSFSRDDIDADDETFSTFSIDYFFDFRRPKEPSFRCRKYLLISWDWQPIFTCNIISFSSFDWWGSSPSRFLLSRCFSCKIFSSRLFHYHWCLLHFSMCKHRLNISMCSIDVNISRLFSKITFIIFDVDEVSLYFIDIFRWCSRTFSRRK